MLHQQKAAAADVARVSVLVARAIDETAATVQLQQQEQQQQQQQSTSHKSRQHAVATKVAARNINSRFTTAQQHQQKQQRSLSSAYNNTKCFLKCTAKTTIGNTTITTAVI